MEGKLVVAKNAKAIVGKNGFFQLWIGTLLLYFLVGCGASDPDYNEVPKPENQVTTNQLNALSSQKFIYNHAITKIPTFVNNTILYDSRDRGAVRLNLTKDGIEVRMLPNDLYTHKNKSDISEWPLVIKIPGKYIDYKCAEDSYEHCINREQVNNDADVSWDQKRYFLPNFEGVVHYNNDNDSALGSTECLQQIGNPTLVTAKKWKGSEIDLEKGVINFELEKSYKLKESESCLIQFKNSTTAGDMHQNSFSTNEFYSLVSSKLLQSGKYEPVPYSRDDYAHFGFFDSATKQQDYSVSRGENDNVGGLQYHNYLNRWDPKRKNITYYLSNNYYLPENKPFLDAAIRMVKAVNVELKEAKTGLPEIKLLRQNEKHFGDLRYSFIALFNPADNFNYSGLTSLVTDTQSGEIVNAYIVMNLPMLSNSKSGLYANIQETFKILNEKSQPKLAESLTTGSDSPAPPPPPMMNAADSPSSEHKNNAQQFVVIKLKNSLFGLETFNANTQGITTAANLVPTLLTVTPKQVNYKPTPGQLPDYLKQFWKTNLSPFYGPNAEFWDDPDFWVGEPKLSAMVAFSDLPKNKQIAISELLSTPFYTAILVHELGHSFGLRHNFKGSTDHLHGFTKASAFYKAVQPKIDHAINKYGEKSSQMLTRYSSVMDYMPYSPGTYFNRIYGAYDLAALRFAYAREVETESKQAFDLHGNWQDLTHYDYMVVAGWKKESPSLDVFGRGAIPYARQNAGAIMRYAYCSDSETQNDFYCNKNDAVSDSEVANSQISRSLVDAFYFNFYGTRAKNGLFDMSELGKSFTTGDFYDTTSSLIKIRHNIARLAKEQGVSDLDDFLNSSSCQSPIDFKAGLNNCMTLRFNLNSTLNMMIALMNINDLDARVTISYVSGNAIPPKPGVPTQFNQHDLILTKDINLTDIYQAAISQHLFFDLTKEAYSNDNSYTTLMQDEQHRSLLKKILVLNNPFIVEKVKAKYHLGSVSEADLIVNVTPSRRSSVATPLNGITRPGSMMADEALNYKNTPAQWPAKLELMQSLLRTNDIDHTDHFANISMVDLDHRSGRFLELFLCNSVMHTDYSDQHLSTAKKPLAYKLNLPNMNSLKNSCYPDVLKFSDIFQRGAILSNSAYAPYPSNWYDNVVGPNLRYNFQNDWGNDPANKFIEPVVKSHSNMMLFDHFGLPYRRGGFERATLRINYLKALLKQVVIGTEDGRVGNYNGHSEDWREYVSVHKVDTRQSGSPIYTYDKIKDQFSVNSQWVNSSTVYDVDTGKSVFIGPKNVLAKKLQTRMAETATKIWHLKNDAVVAPIPQSSPKLAQAQPLIVTSNAPKPVKRPSLLEYQRQSENLRLQLKRDKNVLFNLLPQLD